jgi:hypothetical protein
MLQKIVFLCVLVFCFKTAWGQAIQRSTIGSIGNVIGTESIKLSQSVGQLSVHETVNNEQVLLRQGFQQASNDFYNYHANGLAITVFPNPNNGQFTISIDSMRSGSYAYRLVALSGQLIEEGKTTNNFSTINVSSKVTTGTYILQITAEDGVSAQHKLVIF